MKTVFLFAVLLIVLGVVGAFTAYFILAPTTTPSSGVASTTSAPTTTSASSGGGSGLMTSFQRVSWLLRVVRFAGGLRSSARLTYVT